MPFNGAGVFSRTPGTRIANQAALVSAQVNDETDNLVDGVNGKANLDGLLPMTGLQALFGDGTAALHGATVQQVQKHILGHATAVGGTVDAVQVTMTPASTTLTNREKIRWTSAGANTITAPTLSKDAGGVTKIIRKGASAALAVGDLGAAGNICEAIYNGTDWILQNPPQASATLTAASTTETLTGTDAAKYLTADGNAALWEKGADIASATTISVGEGGTFDVTGTTTITDIDPATDKAGRTFRLVHEAAHILTHHATTMINLTGANITTAVGDISTWQSEGSDAVRMIAYAKKDGTALAVAVTASAWTSIATLSPSAVATIEQTGLSSYKAIRITGMGIRPANDDVEFYIRLSSDGSTYLTSNYSGNTFDTTNENAWPSAIAIANPDSAAGDIGNAAGDGGLDFSIIISSFDAAQKTKAHGTFVFGETSGSIIDGVVSGAHTDQTAMQALRFMFSAGNITSGTIVIEGMA